MTKIATLTMNPTIDVSYTVACVRHTHKMRTEGEDYAPGGGGINVARVLARLGSEVRCLYLSGGATGPALDGLLEGHGLDCERIAIEGPTRIATAVLQTQDGREYRFTPRGPQLHEAEWQACLTRLEQAPGEVMVLSGSLPRGVPDDFYARAARGLQSRGVRVVLDTSGPALARAIAQGGLHLVKPSQGELEAYAGRRFASPGEIGAAAMEIVAAGKARLVAVSMGHRGAVLARAQGAVFLPAVEIEAASAVGAGDSFVAGMVHALVGGSSETEAFRHAMAAGAAAVSRPGTGLAHPDDIASLLGQVGAPIPVS